jgi:hypothetical protein
MHAAIRSPLAAGIALVGAGTIAATPIAAPPPDIHMSTSDIRLTASTQVIQVNPLLIQVNPVAAGARLVGQTTSDALTQAARVATVPIARALVMNLSRALGGGVIRAETAIDASPTSAIVETTPAAMERRGGGLIGTIQNVVVDGVVTTVRLVPATINAGLGVAVSTINAVVQTGVVTARAVLNVGAAALTLNPGAVVNAAAIGAVRIAGTVEQTTIGAPARRFNSPQPEATISEPTVRTRIPSIMTSILNGRQKIADAIFPSAVKARSARTAAPSASALTASAAADQNDTPTPAAKTTADSTTKATSTAKAPRTSSKHSTPKDATK